MSDRGAVRVGSIAGTVVAVALLAACSGPGPDVSPSPSATATPTAPSPSASPVASTGADGRALPGFVTVGVDLPDALPAPPGILADTAPGWVLATYRPTVYPSAARNEAGFAATAQVIYLVDPDGVRYQLLELDPAKPIIVDSWSAGASVAYVRACALRCGEGTGPELSLDLTTGKTSRLTDVAATTHVGATLPGGVRWWQHDAGVAGDAALEHGGVFTQVKGDWVAWSGSPSGRFLAVTRSSASAPLQTSGVGIVDTTTGTITDAISLLPQPLQCAPFRWRAGDILDIRCDDTLTGQIRAFSVGAEARESRENKSVATEPPAGSPWVEPDFFVAPDVWAGPFSAPGSPPRGADPVAGLARDGKFEQLPLPTETSTSSRVVAAVGGSVYLQSSATGGSEPSLATASRDDIATGKTTVLIPLPPGGPTRGLTVNEGAAAASLTSWVVAP